MRTQQVTKQLIAFTAACVVVFTLWYIWILWRNQSAERVLHLGAGQLIYQTSDFAIGTVRAHDGSDKVTLLRFTPDGGWVIAGNGRWLKAPLFTSYAAQVALIPNHTALARDAAWLCAVQRDRRVTSIELYDSASPKKSETYEFHQGGIVEPVDLSTFTQLRGLSQGHTVFSVTLGDPRN